MKRVITGGLLLLSMVVIACGDPAVNDLPYVPTPPPSPSPEAEAAPEAEY